MHEHLQQRDHGRDRLKLALVKGDEKWPDQRQICDMLLYEVNQG
jgi:hypothetical protein